MMQLIGNGTAESLDCKTLVSPLEIHGTSGPKANQRKRELARGKRGFAFLSPRAFVGRTGRGPLHFSMGGLGKWRKTTNKQTNKRSNTRLKKTECQLLTFFLAKLIYSVLLNFFSAFYIQQTEQCHIYTLKCYLEDQQYYLCAEDDKVDLLVSTIFASCRVKNCSLKSFFLLLISVTLPITILITMLLWYAVRYSEWDHYNTVNTILTNYEQICESQPPCQFHPGHFLDPSKPQYLNITLSQY